MQEFKQVSVLRHLWNSRHVFGTMLKNKRIMLAIGLIACYMTLRNTVDTFWPLLVTERLQIAEENLSIFATIKTLIMLTSYFVVVPHVNADRFRHPMLLALGLLVAQLGITIFLAPGAYFAVVIGAVMEGVAMSILTPLTSALQTMSIPAEERARMQGFFFTICLLVTSPFGMIAGALSDMNRVLPMLLSLALLCGCICFTLLLHRNTAAEKKLPRNA